MSHLLCQGAIYGPTALKSPIEYFFRQSSECHPFNEKSAFALMFQMSVCAPISRLLHWRGPAAVVWRVRTVVVNAVNRVSRRWAWPHVSQKCSKVKPLIADANAAPSIESTCRIGASLFHAYPSLILRRTAASRMPMCQTRWHSAILPRHGGDR